MKCSKTPASTLVNRALCLDDNGSVIDKLTQDLLALYSGESHSSDDETETHGADRLTVLKRWIVQLTKSRRSKAFLQPTFLHVMKFMPSSEVHDTKRLADMQEVCDLICELQDSYSTVSESDQRTLKRILEPFMELKGATDDASFLIHWALTEAAKFCIDSKFDQETLAYQYLNSIQTIVSDIDFYNKFRAHLLCNFWQLFDKQLQDRVTDSSSWKLVPPTEESLVEFYLINRARFQLWSLKHRPEFAKLGLIVDNPAECWRNMNIKMCIDLESKFLGSSQGTASFSMTLMSLNANHWRENLQLLTSSAKQLGDKDLLQGLERMGTCEGFNIGNCETASVMLANLEARYEDAYKKALEIKDPTDQTLIEFLDSAIELNKFDEFEQQVQRLSSSKIRLLYEQYHKSRFFNSDVIKVSEVKKWLSSWSKLGTESKLGHLPPSTQTQIDLIVPTLLNSIVKNAPATELIDFTRQMIGQDLIAHSVFCLEPVNKNYKLFNILLNCLSGDSTAFEDDSRLVESLSGDVNWNNKLYRHLDNLNLGQRFESVPYRAAKFNFKRGNLDLARRIAQDIVDRSTSSNETRILVSILEARYSSISKESKLSRLCLLASKACLCEDIDPVGQRDIVLQIARHNLKLTGCVDLVMLFKDFNQPQANGLKSDEHLHSTHWQKVPIVGGESNFQGCDNESLIKTFIVISDTLSSVSSDEPEDVQELFLLQIDLLKLISNHSRPSSFDGQGMKCATKILELIQSRHDLLSDRTRDVFVKSFQQTPGIWLNVRKNLIAHLIFDEHLPAEWRGVMRDLLEQLVIKSPYLFVYEAIAYMDDFHLITTLEQQDTYEHHDETNLKRTRDVWRDVFKTLKSPEKIGVDLDKMLLETREFILEIKRISYLPTDSLLRVVTKVLCKVEKLRKQVRGFDENSDTKQMAASCRDYMSRMKIILGEYHRSVRILTEHCKQKGVPGGTYLDIWFSDTFKHEGRDTLLDVFNRILKAEDFHIVRNLVERSLVPNLEGLRMHIAKLCEESKYKFYTIMISDMLSYLNLPNILMPGLPAPAKHQPPGSAVPVTIKSVHQTVTLICSLTRPKCLKLLGSDGVSRPFLLKTHEDLRLDQTIMELFGSLNQLFESKKTTRGRCRLREYSVTPLSTRSGLIQWIEAPSVGSFARDWLPTPIGLKTYKSLYEGTCEVLCKAVRDKPESEHQDCKPPRYPRSLDVFYQLLWAEIRQDGKFDRPSRANTTSYRELGAGYFENVHRKLLLKMPKELVSNQLWYSSYNAHEFWSKTQSFIRSCATISMVGYLIGLGDRHIDNMLIDCQRGEFVHVDYNACFEMAKVKTHSAVPETVPFRLTPNILRAFGFAGLEGAFTNCCRDVLDVLRANKSIPLSHLNGMRLSFKIDPRVKLPSETQDTDPFDLSAIGRQQSNGLRARLPRENDLTMDELNLCSQELLEEHGDDCVGVAKVKAETSPRPKTVKSLNGDKLSSPTQKDSVGRSVEKEADQRWFDVHHDINTPPKLPIEQSKRIFKRIQDKLNGIDDELLVTEQLDRSGKRVDDDKLRRVMTTSEQVDALIREATSFRNLAAMYEGWQAWL